jgi:hypothetical protein
MPKRGDIDKNTGRVFWCKRKRTHDYIEEWISREKFEERNKKLIARRKKRYENRKQEYKEKAKEYYEENSQKCIQRICKRQKNNEKVLKYKRDWIKTKRKDPNYKLISNYRNLIYLSLIKQSTSKENTSFELLGLNGKEFMEYLLSHDSCEKHFTSENYGEVWHVDHIKPLAAFDLSNTVQIKNAFHYSNCQPLSVADNLSKSSLYNGQKHKH